MKMSLKFLLITAVLWKTVSTNPEPGDIVEYPRALVGCNVYSHYAVFVGDESMAGKKPGQNTFEMTMKGGKTNCYYGSLEAKYKVNNYLDKDVKPKSWPEMKDTMEHLLEKCGSWHVTNTCEHVSTRVRYGEGHSVCQQRGTVAEWFYKCRGRRSLRRRRSRFAIAAAAAA